MVFLSFSSKNWIDLIFFYLIILNLIPLFDRLGMNSDPLADTTEREAIYKQASLYKKKEKK